MMSDKNLMLVNAVKKYKCLYNFGIPEYTKKDETDNAWAEVARNMQQTVYECKEKWRNLRYSFLRSLKPNADGTFKKRYYLYKEMEFLMPFMKTRFDGIVTPVFDEETDEEIPDIISGEEVIIEEQPQQLDFSSLDFSTEPPPKKRRIQHRAKDNGNNDSWKGVVGNNDCCPRKMFLLSLLPEINNLTEVQMKVFRRKVFTLIDEISQDEPIITDILEPEDELLHFEQTIKKTKEDARQEREFIMTIKTEKL